MFTEGDLDLKKRTQKDEVLTKVQELTRSRYFEQYFHLLAAVYDASA